VSSFVFAALKSVLCRFNAKSYRTFFDIFLLLLQVGTLVREEDRRVYMHGHSMEEKTAEQERSADYYLQECIMLRDNVFSLPSYYTRTDIELIIQHLCRSD